jgi:hypothetical protein
MGLPLLQSSSSVNERNPSFRVCSWALNWGRILLQNVTITGVNTNTAGNLTSELVVPETGQCSGSHSTSGGRCHAEGSLIMLCAQVLRFLHRAGI